MRVKFRVLSTSSYRDRKLLTSQVSSIAFLRFFDDLTWFGLVILKSTGISNTFVKMDTVSLLVSDNSGCRHAPS